MISLSVAEMPCTGLGSRSRSTRSAHGAIRCSARRTALGIVAILGLSGPAKADSELASDAVRLAEGWASPEFKLRATRLAPLFLERDHPRVVRLPESSRTSGPSSLCTTVGVIAGRSVDFALLIDPVIVPKHRPTGGFVQRSVAGTAVLTRCGSERQSLDRLAIELRASRAALEIVMATGPGPAPAISRFLPERATGPLAPPIDAGPRPRAAPLSERAASAEAKARRAGATRVERREMRAGPEGMGAEEIELAEGCHRLVLMPDAADSASGSTDLDAEVRDGSTGRILSRDRSDASDARLDLCSGDRSRHVLLGYTGAEGNQPLLLCDAVFEIPPGVPRSFGARVRAGLSAALFRHRFAPLSSEPTDLTLGAAGLTPVHPPIEPGACYVAAVTAMSGEPRLLALSASIDARRLYDVTGRGSDGSAIAFCAEQGDRGYLEVEMRGGAGTWLLAIWKVATLEMGEKAW